jgi:hypothetical protein
MINFQKNNILTYSIILLLLINIGVIGMVVFQKCSMHRPKHGCPPPGKDMAENRCMAEFLQQDLKFSKEQMDKYKDLKSQFHPKAKFYFDSLEKLESDFFIELEKPNTDTTKLFSYAQQFSRLQYDLKHQTIEHLIKIKLICSPEQQKKYFNHILENRHCREGMEMPPPDRHSCPEMKK